MKALVVESSREVVGCMSVLLQLHWPGAALLSVAGDGKGIELVEAESPDVVILDLDLPSTDGLDVLKQIRLFSDVPLIVLTSSDREMDQVSALEAGADCCIVKPLSPAEFLARVKALLRRASWRRAPASARHRDLVTVMS